MLTRSLDLAMCWVEGRGPGMPASKSNLWHHPDHRKYTKDSCGQTRVQEHLRAVEEFDIAGHSFGGYMVARPCGTGGGGGGPYAI